MAQDKEIEMVVTYDPGVPMLGSFVGEEENGEIVMKYTLTPEEAADVIRQWNELQRSSDAT